MSGAALYCAAAVLAASGLLCVRHFYHDDAFITLRYASRLLAGHGPTWNDGEYVEGFTHPLWLAQVTLLGGLGVDLIVATRVLGLAYLAGLFALWWWARATPLTLLLVATQPGVLLWTLGGLETTSLCFWLAAAAWLALQAHEQCTVDDVRAVRTAACAGAAFAAAALTRPEGFGAGLLALCWVATARRAQPLLSAAAGFFLPVGAYLAFRAAYYGDYLPNTARAKIEGFPVAAQLDAGLHYLNMTAPEWLPGAFAAALCLMVTPRGRSAWIVLLAFPVLAALLLGGGDHMAGARLVVPAIVLIFFAAGTNGAATTRGRARLTAAVVCAAVAWQVWFALWPQVTTDRAAFIGERVGRFLQAHLPPGALVATATAGSTPYFAPALRFVDSLGLNDRHIARRVVTHPTTSNQRIPGHGKGDGAYVLSRRPDVIILGPAEGYLGADPRVWFLTDFELLMSEEFHLRYRPYRFRVDSSSERPVTIYVRDDSAAAASLIALGTPMTPPWEGAPETRAVAMGGQNG